MSWLTLNLAKNVSFRQVHLSVILRPSHRMKKSSISFCYVETYLYEEEKDSFSFLKDYTSLWFWNHSHERKKEIRFLSLSRTSLSDFETLTIWGISRYILLFLKSTNFWDLNPSHKSKKRRDTFLSFEVNVFRWFWNPSNRWKKEKIIVFPSLIKEYINKLVL